MTSIYDTYAAKICSQLELKPRAYDMKELCSYIMDLPLAEVHAAHQGVDLEKLPRLGDTLSLKAHMQACFFDILMNPVRPLTDLTRPILIKREHLERLEGWRDWRTLSVYLHQENLEPAAVFRNTPITIKTAPFESEVYYAADIRVMLGRKEAYMWKG